MGLQGLENRLRVVICEGRVSTVRSCLFLPLPRRAGCARKARSATRHLRRVRRLRLPAHGKAVQHAPNTYVSTHGAVHTHVCLCVSLSFCLFVCRPPGVCTHVHTHPCVRVCIVFTYVCMHTRMYVCTHVLCSFARHVCACMCVFLHGPTSGTRRTSGVIVVRMAGCYVLVLWSMFSGGGAWAFKVWEIV